MAYDEDLAERIRGMLGDRPVLEQRMFGGLAFLVGGHIGVCASRQGGLMLRVPPEQTETLLGEPGAGEMVMRGRTMIGWLRVDIGALGDDVVLQTWVERGVGYAASLPPK